MSKGKMIQRSTPQKTMEYYLRLVGEERGIHTMRQGDTEVISSNGRLSLFHRGEEVSAPSGFSMNITSMGQYHAAVQAHWEITEQSATGCVALGRMARLPVKLIWRMNLENSCLAWDIELECEREVSITQIEVNSVTLSDGTDSYEVMLQ